MNDHDRRSQTDLHAARSSRVGLESVCRRGGFSETGPKFLTILKRQRKHADERGLSDGGRLLDGLIEEVAEAQ